MTITRSHSATHALSGRPRVLAATRLWWRALVLAAAASAAHAQTITESTLYSFTGGVDGSRPAAALIQAGDGQLYGTTFGNITSDYGGVFRLSADGALTPLHRFSGASDSAAPLAPVVMGTDGNLYGTTFGNLLTGTKGTVFKLSTDSSTLVNLFNFTSDANGGQSESGLTLGTDGSFYGSTSAGGTGKGVLFRLTASGALSVLASLNTFNGATPTSPPIEGSDGNFYGVMAGGGTSSFGTVYQMTPAGALTTLYTFKGIGDGAAPQGPLVEGPDGNFYGATGAHGEVSAANGGSGTIFSITPAGVFTTLHVFNSATDGRSPWGLVLASDGNLYGAAFGGGANNQGTVFRITRAGTFTTLYSFAATGDGATPQGGLLQGGDGHFYGTTYSGGTASLGTVFRLTLSPALAAPVRLTPSAASVPLGASLTLSWQALNAFSKTFQNCYASAAPASGAGIWSGRQAGTYDVATQIYSGSATITPTLPGTYTFGLICGGVESATTTVIVGEGSSLQLTTSSLPEAKVGVAYLAAVGVSGGVQPYSFNIRAGSLPDGLALNSSSGVISGTPTQAGVSHFTIQVQDSNPATVATVSADFDITTLVPLLITNTGLAAGVTGAPYSQTLTATGGTPPYSWKLSGSSALPGGLSLSADGVISGTPTSTGTTNLSVEVADTASQVASGAFSITIAQPIGSIGTITLNPSSIQIGHSTVATVHLTAPAGSPAFTGSVQFQANAVNLGAPVAVSDGTASQTIGPFTATGSFAITAHYAGDPYYQNENSPPTMLAVSTEPAPAIGITPSSVRVTAGEEVSLTVTVLNFSSQSIAFSCGNLPANVSCTFGSLNADGTATLFISTVKFAALRGPSPPDSPVNRTMPAFIVPSMLMFSGRAFTRRSARLRRASLWLGLLLICAVLSACGGSDLGYAKAGTSTITVTAVTAVAATAESETASTQITLIVQ